MRRWLLKADQVGVDALSIEEALMPEPGEVRLQRVSSGWVAHVLEQREQGDVARPDRRPARAPSSVRAR